MFTLRPTTPREEAFVFAGWIRSSASFVPSKVYRPNEGKGPLTTKSMHGKVWTDLLALRICRLMPLVMVAEAEGALIGFVCGDRDAGLLHYVYVERRFRRRGVASRMLAHIGFDAKKPVTVTHWTPFADLLLTAPHWDERSLEK